MIFIYYYMENTLFMGNFMTNIYVKKKKHSESLSYIFSFSTAFSSKESLETQFEVTFCLKPFQEN